MDFIDKIKTLYKLDKTKNFGFKESEIQAFESRESIVLPSVLRNYYLTLGKNNAINNSFNVLLNPVNQMGFSADRHLVFYEENQSVAFWGIKAADLKLDNPPIYGNFDAVNLNEAWFLDNTNTADFLLTMAFWNGVMGGLKYVAIASEDCMNQAIEAIIEKNWQEIDKITNQDLRFFTNDYTEMIALTNDAKQQLNGLFIGSNNKKTYLNIINQLQIAWDYRSDED